MRFVPLTLLIPVLQLGVCTPARAQSPLALNASLGAHALTVPWYAGSVGARFNPALMVGAERTLRSGGFARWYHTANIGFFQHHWWMTGVSVDTELGANRALPAGFQTDLRLGIGYLHYFWRRETLELRNGRYVEATDWGRPSLLVPLSLLIGYRGTPERPITVSPFVSVRWALQVLFLDEIPATSHFLLSLGARIELERGGTD